MHDEELLENAFEPISVTAVRITEEGMNISSRPFALTDVIVSAPGVEMYDMPRFFSRSLFVRSIYKRTAAMPTASPANTLRSTASAIAPPIKTADMISTYTYALLVALRSLRNFC